MSTALTYSDVAAVSGLSRAEAESIGWPVIDALRSLPVVSPGQVDNAGVPIRGGSVYAETLDNRFTRRQLCAARKALMLAGTSAYVIECINAAIPAVPGVVIGGQVRGCIRFRAEPPPRSAA